MKYNKKEELKKLFYKTKQAALAHKTYFDELVTIIEDSEYYNYCIVDPNIDEITETLIDAQGDMNFPDFLNVLEKHRYNN